MEAVTSDSRIENAVVQSQDAALGRLLERDFGATLRRYVSDTLRLPPRPAPEVAWDFWTQFDQFERFEELRQFRPALYRALPAEPGSGTGDSGSAEPRIPNSEPRIPNSESRVSNSASRVPNSESRVPNPESRTPNPESRS
jgi:hypothetical protein